MKKRFRTFIDQSAAVQEIILFSAGRVGMQLEMPLANLQKLLPIETADLILEFHSL
jgi:Cys-tRNA(Pro)/Cys-tRNA(Cys) deacylase